MDFKKLNNNKFYKKCFKSAWPYITGAVLLSVFQIVTLATTEEPWGVSEAYAFWGTWIYRIFGGNVEKWHYFNSEDAQAALNSGFLNDPPSIRNLGIIFGALISILLASEFKLRKIKSKKQIVAAALGGILMGYGARVAHGCTIGALYSGISSLSLSGWVYAVFLFLGSMVGSKLLIKFFM